MIFVTVGNATQPFDRLLEGVDGITDENLTGLPPIFMQTGHSRFRPRHADWQDFLSSADFEAQLRRADVVVCHGGCTVFQALRAGKYPVVMPRLKKYGEHVNDHQLAFVRALAKAGYILPAYESSELAAAIGRARAEKGRALPPSTMASKVVEAISTLFPAPKI